MSGPRLRIAHFTVAPEFVDNIMIHDLRRLRSAFDMIVICSGTSEACRREGIPQVMVRAHRKLSPFADLASIIHLRRQLRREQIDILHTYAPKAGLIGQIAGLFAGVTLRIHSCRGLLYEPGQARWRRMLFRWTDRVTNALAHRVLFVSAADRDYAVQQGLCKAAKARHTGSGIDLTRFSRSAASDARERVRRSLGIPLEATVALTVGRFVREKGFAEIAHAARALRTAHPEVHYLWVAPVMSGESNILPDDLANRHGVSDLVTRTGYIDDMAGVYAAADLLVHPSHREGVPRAVMEGAAMGLPVIASAIPGCREVIDDGYTGWLFAPGDAAALARALAEALSDAEERARRARAGEAAVRGRFDQDALSQRIAYEYHQLVNELQLHNDRHAAPVPMKPKS